MTGPSPFVRGGPARPAKLTVAEAAVMAKAESNPAPVQALSIGDVETVNGLVSRGLLILLRGGVDYGLSVPGKEALEAYRAAIAALGRPRDGHAFIPDHPPEVPLVDLTALEPGAASAREAAPLVSIAISLKRIADALGPVITHTASGREFGDLSDLVGAHNAPGGVRRAEPEFAEVYPEGDLDLSLPEARILQALADADDRNVVEPFRPEWAALLGHLRDRDMVEEPQPHLFRIIAKGRDALAALKHGGSDR